MRARLGATTYDGPDDHRRDLVWVDESRGVALLLSGTEWTPDSGDGKELIAQVASTIDAFAPDMRAGLIESFDAADRRVRRAAIRPEVSRPTFLMAVLDPHDAAIHIAHAGDSRAYVVRENDDGAAAPLEAAPNFAPQLVLDSGGLIACVTADHTTACELVEMGFVTAKAGRDRARHRILTRTLGGEPASIPELTTVPLETRDRVLLCSAGVWLPTDANVLAWAMRTGDDPARGCEALVNAAKAATAEQPVNAIAMFMTDAPADTLVPESSTPDVPFVDDTIVPSNAAAVTTPAPGILGTLGRDLTVLASQRSRPMIGRQGEIRRLMRTLMRMQKPNPMLVGEPGVGKTWLVEALAWTIQQVGCPKPLRNKRIIELSIGALLSGTRFRGDFEERLESVLEEAEANPDVILFLDEIHLAVGAGSTVDSSVDVANLLKPALARGRMQVIGATTSHEYDRYIARDEAFTRRFELVRIEEPSRAEAISILNGIKPALEEHHELTVSDEAIAAAVDLSVRYVPDRRLPDKAIDLIDQACVRSMSRWLSMSLRTSAGAGDGVVRREDVVAVVAERCQVPEDLIALDDKQRLANLHELLERRVLGQDHAVQTVARAVQRGYGGLREPTKPVASFLLTGPTGVGKTSMAIALAEYVFANPEALLRIDMSEYMETNAIARLLGSPPGYVGHEEDGLLATHMRRHPGCVVLFDEIEKAHPDILQVLLQILDNGMARDARGNEASFRQAIVVLTSNLLVQVDTDQRKSIGVGSQPAPASSGADEASLRKKLEAHLRPELIGRIDHVIRLTELTPDTARAIAEGHLQRVVERLLAHGTISAPPLKLRESILERAAGFRHGARDIERLVEAAVGEWIVERGSDPDDDVAPGTTVLDRLGSRERATVAMLLVRTDDVRNVLDEMRAHPAGGDLVMLRHAGNAALGLCGTVSAALALAVAFPSSQRFLHWGTVSRAADGVVGSYELDELLRAPVMDSTRVIATAAALDHLSETQRLCFETSEDTGMFGHAMVV
jgi:ATP-dependent Clp protease ATP-binding subunit ClpC